MIADWRLRLHEFLGRRYDALKSTIPLEQVFNVE
jgi:hypothetical protein